MTEDQKPALIAEASGGNKGQTSLGSDKKRKPTGRRALEEQRSRRKRDGTRTSGQFDILHVPQEVRDDAARRGVSLHWARANSVRNEQLSGLEWTPTKYNGSNVFKPAGGNDSDKLMLMEKDSEWLKEDLAERQKRIDLSLQVEDGNDALKKAKSTEGEALVGYQRGERIVTDKASEG